LARCFFFSSRRRHTRFSRDWSSDVCSSDLAMQFTGIGSMIGVHMTDRPLRSAADAAKGHAGLLDLFYFDLVERGIWFAKRGMMRSEERRVGKEGRSSPSAIHSNHCISDAGL